MKNKKSGIKIEPDMLIWICSIVGIVCIALQLLLASFTKIPPLYSGIGIAVAYGVASVAIIIKSRITVYQYTEMHREITMTGAAMTHLVEQSDIPAVITHDDGTIVWYNSALGELLDTGAPLFGKNMSRFCPFDIEELKRATVAKDDLDTIALARAKAEGTSEVIDIHNSVAESGSRLANGRGGLEYTIEGRRFLVKTYTVKVPSDKEKNELRNYHLTVFDEATELFNLKDKTSRENLVVAYIVLDNLEELAQYVKVDYRQAANNIEMHIKSWANSIGGVMCEYGRDKYLVFLAQEKLEETIENSFPILKTIRSEEVGDGTMSVTVSMGISGVGNTISEREQNAQMALDTALRRGGDQVVIKKENALEFFGGRAKGLQKQGTVSSRVIADQLAELIRAHSKIMIMGHKNPDCDSIGASIGMARFAKSIGGDSTAVRVVIDTDCDTFKACTAGLIDMPEYKNVFLGGPAALDAVSSDTLLIIVDANNFKIIESADVAKSVSDIVVIDHHRKVSEIGRPLLIEYIDPSASSASELVSEMIESALSENELLKEEADILLSGIMLDTMNFTRSTGMRTFSAAYFLRSAGASSEKARSFFEDDITQHLAEAKFFMPENVTVYREHLAIAISMGTDEKYDRVAASKAAERLITVRKVNAAFALVKIGDTIHISARSTGTINVQLILEKLRGGGHFDSAGAQVTGRTMNEVLVILKGAINQYLDE